MLGGLGVRGGPGEAEPWLEMRPPSLGRRRQRRRCPQTWWKEMRLGGEEAEEVSRPGRLKLEQTDAVNGDGI